MDFKSTINFGQADRAATAGLVAGLDEALQQQLATSNQRVPTDTGELEASGQVVIDAASLRGAVTYTAGHAAIVHERLDLSHDDGQPKFLESTQASEASRSGQTIAAAVRRRL